MKKLLLGWALLALAACQPDPEKKAAVEASPAGYEFAHLPFFDEGVTDITIQIAWPSDYAWRDGVNLFTPYVAAEAILSEGAAGLNAQELMEAFNDKNAKGHLQVQADHVVGTLSFPYEHTEFVASVAQEILLEPKYTQGWLTRVGDKLATNQANVNQQEHAKLWGAARMAVLGDTLLYRALTASDAKLAQEVTREEVLDWHQTYLTRQPTAISVAGRITAEDAGKLIDQLLTQLPEAIRTFEPKQPGNYAATNVYLEIPDAKKTAFGMIGSLPPTADGQDHIDLIALQALSKTEGPLFNAVRADLRAAYAVFAGFQNYDRRNRFMYIYSEVEAEKLAEAIDVVRKTYGAFRAGPGMEGIVAVRDDVSASVMERMQYVDVSAQAMLQMMLDGIDPIEVDRFSDKFEDVTVVATIERMSEAFVPSTDLIVVASGPNAADWPGACVITSVEEVLNCRRSPGS